MVSTPDEPDWTIWSKADAVDLQDAVALSLDIGPNGKRHQYAKKGGSLHSLAEPSRDKYCERLTLSLSHLGRDLPLADSRTTASSPPETSKVRLIEFANFARCMDWELPHRFPGQKPMEERDEIGALIPNTTRLKPEWGFYVDIPNPLLWMLVAMSCDIDPGNIDLFNPVERHVPDLVQFWKRFTIAQANVEAGRLTVVDMGMKLPGDFNFATAVSWNTFIKWMTGLSRIWELPKEFPYLSEAKPNPATPVATLVVPTDPTKNVEGPVYLPHMTKDLEKIFRVMNEHWGSYDPKNPPKQTVIASALDEALGWKPDTEGNPSRNAQNVAALIRPDELKKADSRSPKRRPDGSS